MAKVDNGLARLNRRLNAIPQNVRAAVQPALLKAGNALADDMRALAPVDDGDLKESIAVTPGGSTTPPYSQPGGRQVVPELQVLVTAGNTKVRYAHLVEFGAAPHEIKGKDGKPMGSDGRFGPVVHHPGTKAEPFFWPAFRLHRKKLASAIKRAIRKAVKDAK